MIPLLYIFSGFEELPYKTRLIAAEQAQQSALRHWQCWASIVATGALIAILGFASHALGIDHTGVFGGAIGFFLGMTLYGWALRKIGTPYFRKLLDDVKRPSRYVVQSDDSWATISVRFGVPVQDLVRMNRGVAGAALAEGQSIRVTKTIEDEF